MERTKTPANAPRDGSDPLTSRYLNLKIARLVANDEPLAFLRLVAGTDVNLQLQRALFSDLRVAHNVASFELVSRSAALEECHFWRVRGFADCSLTISCL